MAIAYFGGGLLWFIYAVITGIGFGRVWGLMWIVFGAIYLLLFSRSHRKGSS
jgi:L-lactate permease